MVIIGIATGPRSCCETKIDLRAARTAARKAWSAEFDASLLSMRERRPSEKTAAGVPAGRPASVWRAGSNCAGHSSPLRPPMRLPISTDRGNLLDQLAVAAGPAPERVDEAVRVGGGAAVYAHREVVHGVDAEYCFAHMSCPPLIATRPSTATIFEWFQEGGMFDER